MKRLFSYLKRHAKRIALVAVIMSAVVAIPLHSVAAVDVVMEGSIGVANQTKGEKTYEASTKAGYDDVVKFQVFYHNRELPTSGRVAKNFRIKINMPTTAGTNQVVKVTMKGDNTNTITDTAVVALNRSDARLDFIPGSTYWKHNAGTRTNMKIVTQKIGDSVILGGGVVENVQPCHEFEATVTFMARVHVPSVSVKKFVRNLADKKSVGVTNLNAQAGAHLEYFLNAKNMGNTTLNNVVLRDALPTSLAFVPGSVKLYNGGHPNGVVINNDYLFHGGVVTGNVGPGATVYITFEANVKSLDKLACGANTIKNVDIVDTDQTGEYFNYAIVNVNKVCENTPTYTCNLLTLDTIGKREISAKIQKSMSGNVQFEFYSFDFGDGSKKLTDQASVTHTYAKDGTYQVTGSATFKVNGKDVTVSSDSCKQVVTFSSKPPVKHPHTPAPTELPNTGAGDVIGIFAAVTVAGAVAHQLFSRRQSR